MLKNAFGKGVNLKGERQLIKEKGKFTTFVKGKRLHIKGLYESENDRRGDSEKGGEWLNVGGKLKSRKKGEGK